MFVSYNPAEQRAGDRVDVVLEAEGGVEEGVPPKPQPKPLKATVPTAPNTVFTVQGAESVLNGEYAADGKTILGCA